VRILRFAALLLLVALPVRGQDQSTGKYKNEQLGISFAGIYGWESRFAKGAGAWTELARYSEAAYDASLILQVRDNPYKTLAELRAAQVKAYKEGGDAESGEPLYKDVSIQDVTMKKGLNLPGVEVRAFVVRVNEEGKKREFAIRVRTFFGKKRLFRVACSVRRARAKRVKDRFDLALASLSIEGKSEAVQTGVLFRSERGQYGCTLPEGFLTVLPAKDANYEVRFEDPKGAIRVTVFSYEYDGNILDQIDDLLDYFGDDIEIIEEEAEVMGDEGLIAKVTQGDMITLVLGTVQNERAYRIHTTANKKKLEDAKRIHAKFLKEFKIAR
jgi:hypothetical protein